MKGQRGGIKPEGTSERGYLRVTRERRRQASHKPRKQVYQPFQTAIYCWLNPVICLIETLFPSRLVILGLS